MNSLSALDSEAWSWLDPASLLEAENGAHKNSILTPPKKTIPGPSILFENKLFLHQLPPVAEHVVRGRGLGAEAVQGRAGPGPLLCNEPGEAGAGRSRVPALICHWSGSYRSAAVTACHPPTSVPHRVAFGGRSMSCAAAEAVCASAQACCWWFLCTGTGL